MIRTLRRWWLNKRIKWATEDQRSVTPGHPHYDAIQRGGDLCDCGLDVATQEA